MTEPQTSAEIVRELRNEATSIFRHPDIDGLCARAASLIEALSAEKAASEQMRDILSDSLVRRTNALESAESTVARLTGEKEIETQKREFAEFEWKRSDERAAAAEARLAEAAQNFRAIKQATVDGRVCDDVAWFDAITTLHDFCELAAINCAVGQRKDGDQRSPGESA
jgi:hypothetical protein